MVSGEFKYCRGCDNVLHLTWFSIKEARRGTRQTYCRVCSAGFSKQHYLRNRQTYKARAALNNKRTKADNRRRLHDLLRSECCADCGLADFAVLDFDHRDPMAKRAAVSTLLRQAVCWRAIRAEIDKCDVVCANCHRRRTARYFGWRKLVGLEELVVPPLPRRGTPDYERAKSMRSRLARLHRNRGLLFKHLTQHPCQLCGIDDPVVLEFDHLGQKARDVCLVALRSGRANLEAEIAKCRVLCANCHRRHTAQQAGRLR